MSTTREGETRGIVESYHTLSDRLNRLLDAAQRPSGDDTNLRILIHCREILKCWEDDELSSVGIRNLSTKPEKVERFRGRIAEANELLPHCGQMLGISFSDNIPAKDDYRHDCFSKLQHTIMELTKPPLVLNYTTIPTSPPSTVGQSTPSPHVRTSDSPAPHAEPHPVSQDYQVYVKQEHPLDQFVAEESPDRVHLRHDSHWSSHSEQGEPRTDNKLPPISAYLPSTMAQIPTTSGYGPILPRPSSMQSSHMDSILNPQTPHHVGSIDGNDHQMVMMSPSSTIQPLQPPISFTSSVPTDFHSIFSSNYRPTSRQNGSSPDH